MIAIATMQSLPEHCYECPCCNGESGYCEADESHRYSDYRPFWCPLKEIVQCKDCKHAKEWPCPDNSDGNILCVLRDNSTKPDWFCHNGEREQKW